MPVLTRQLSTFFVKVEVTEGTDAVPTATDALQLTEHAVFSWGAEIMNAQSDLNNQLLDEAFPLPPAAKFAEVTAKGWCRGRGSAYDAGTGVSELHALLQAAGLAGVFTTSRWDFDTASTGTKTVTIYGFRETDTGVWVKYAILGARVTSLRFRMSAGKPIEWEATIRGLFVQPSDGGQITPTYQTAVPPLFFGASSWALGSYSTGLVRSAEVGLDLTIVPQLSANAVDGLAGYKPSRRRSPFSARFEGARIADYDAFTAWKTAPQNALVIAVGTAANNKMTITADKATIAEAPTYEDDQGLWLHAVAGLCSPEGTNRMKITFGP